MGDIIKAPSHYVDGRKYEPKDVIRDWGLNFNLGSAVKYISRAGRKGDKLEDLQKAKQFLEFEIEGSEEENSDIEIETVNERMISAYVNGLFYRVIVFNSIPDEYKPIVIDKIAQKVLDNQWDIVRDIHTKELQDMVVGWIIELINNDELDRMDIPEGLYNKCERIRATIANSEYRKAMDAVRKYAEDREMVTINFEFEVDPDIDTDTVNVHVHIKNEED